ncbi:MAG: thioredoxin domain-containing protein [Deltaproteobacteria bacterium]|nr:thioredoxin domain-containing protein [Deltaproteobacteria bacterium]
MPRIARCLALSATLAALSLHDARADVPTAAPLEATKPERWKVAVGSSPSRGPKDALVTLVVWSDFECIFCRKLAVTLEDLRARYPNELRIVFKHHPLPMHRNAEPAAELAEEARAQGKDDAFWRIHDALFKTMDLSHERLLELAANERLDVKRVEKALAERRHKKAIDAAVDEAEDLEANGTPTSFVNGVRMVGAQPLERFVTTVEAELGEARRLVATGIAPAKLHDHLVGAGKVKPEPEFKRRAIAAPTRATPTRGPRNAPVTVHVFTDFECPYCGGARETVDELVQAYRGKVRLAYHSLPLPFHPHAREAASFALEAFAQRGDAGFWRAHDLLFANQSKLGRDELLLHAKTLRLDVERVRKALDERVHDAAIDADGALAEQAGISATPTFVVNELSVEGAESLRVFKLAVERALAERKAGPGAAPAPKR